MILLLFLLISIKVFAYEQDDSLRKRMEYTVVKEPIVKVDRYDVRQLQNDPSVLVSAEERTKPMIESKFSEAYKKEVQVIYMQAEQKKVEDEDVKITATIESDSEEAVNYQL